MVNKQIVNRLLDNLHTYVRQLKQADDLDYQTFNEDIRSQRFVEHTLQISVECVLDIAHHIISDEKFREPDSYAEAFVVLAENDVITAEMRETGRLMAQFRNKVVHYYEDVDPDLVFNIFQKHLSDFERFEREIQSWLQKQ